MDASFLTWVPSEPKSSNNNAQKQPASTTDKRELPINRDDMDVSAVFVRQEDL